MAEFGLHGQLVAGGVSDSVAMELLKGRYIKRIEYNAGTGLATFTVQDENGDELDPIVVALHALSPLTSHYVNSIPGILAKLADIQVMVTARAWADVTDLALGGFASSDAGNLGPVHASALDYVLSKIGTAGDSNNNYVYIEVPISRDSRDYRIRQNGSLGEFFITSWDHVGIHNDANYYRSRHNLFQGYNISIQYDEVTATQTHFRGTTDAFNITIDSTGFGGLLALTDDTAQKVAQAFNDFVVNLLDSTEANDGSSETFGLISGQLIAGAIEAHHTTQYTWLTELRLDFRNPQAGTEPQFHILNVSGEATHNRILEFSNLTTIDADFIRSVVNGTIVNVEGSFFTVFAYVASGTDLWLQGEFDSDPTLVDEDNYRLRFTAPRPNDAEDISVDTSDLGGKLAGVAANVQAMLEAIDDFVFASGLGGNPNWTDVQGRPNRPSAAELLGGINTDEAVASVSDIVALINNHRRVLSNHDPVNVGNTAEEGTEPQVSRRDHGHRFPHNNTILYDETAGNFGINIHDVTEHTGQTIRYFTNADTFTSGGGLSEGQIYTTSGFRKLITKVQLQTSNLLGAHFRVRIKTVDSDRIITGDLGRSFAVNPGSTNPHSYPFYDADGNVGIVEEGNQRIAILLEGNEAGDTSALRYGDQASDSPGESYPDASVDFHLENDVVYADRDPAIGQHSHSHGNDIRGNIKIFYQLIYGHDDLGSEIEPSDAIPQPNTEEGSAGDGENYSRDTHSHPGTAGGGTGESREVLFDNRADTETALSVLAGGVDWGRTIDIGFSRALVEADDDKDIRLRYEITQGGQIRHFDELFSAATFRLMPEYAAVSGSIMPTTGHLVFTGVDGRTSRTATSLFGRVSIGVRQRTTDGEDALRILMSSSGNSHVAATNIRGIAELVPRVGGGISAAQAASGANLTRSTVALGVQQTTNAFEFDVRVGGTIGVGNYQINPIPVTDIFDLVASVNVDGRGALPMRLSKEQFDLVGESPELVQTGAWPFAGTGGTTWGDVTQIPCAMMYIDHVTEGIAKNLINPQRQQIGWTISGSLVATAILFFFDYDDAEENLTNVRVVAFSNSVVVIEGLHIHYWQAG